jgi:hypothetical protein
MALRTIKPGEELTYDYGEEYFDRYLKGYCLCPKHAKAKAKKLSLKSKRKTKTPR